MASNYIIPAVAFVALANPKAFKIVRGVAGGWVASAEGLPTLAGLILHAVVFVLIVGFIMNLQYKNKENFRFKDLFKKRTWNPDWGTTRRQKEVIYVNG